MDALTAVDKIRKFNRYYANVLGKIDQENSREEVDKMIDHLSEQERDNLVNSMEMVESILSAEQKSALEVSIRSFRSGDVGYVAYLHGKLYRETYGFGKTFEYYVMKGLTEFLLDSEGGDLWLAEVKGRIVGSIAITRSDEKTAQLRWFVIDAEYQGLGIGKKLMNTALAFCKEREYQRVFLWTVSILNTARHLYHKYNFTLTEEKENDLWTGKTITEERWDLTL